MKILHWIRKEWVLVILLLVLAVVSRFWLFGYPDRIVFDELYFAKFVSHYFLHSYYFDIHPPLAKLIMAGVAQLTGADPNLTFGYNAINEAYPDGFYLLLRGIVSFFGSLLPLAVYALSRSLKFSVKVSFLAGLFVILDNAFLMQSRFILTDAFLLTFGTLGLACVIYAIRNTIYGIRYTLLVVGSLLLGASYSVKWTGLLFLGLALLFVILSVAKNLKLILKSLIIILVSSFLVYFISMSIHLGQLTKTGPGDAFMSVEFQSTLLGNANMSPVAEAGPRPPSFVSKFIELNSRMFSANAGITAGHPYGSKWYTWPFMQRSVYYWYDRVDDSHEARIYLIGNPLIWWGGLLALLFILFVKPGMRIWRRPGFDPTTFLFIAFIANLLPYIFISRVAFLYHYLPSLVFLCIGLAYVLSKIRNWWIIGAIVLVITATFIWLLPISYGTPLIREQFDSRMLLRSWE